MWLRPCPRQHEHRRVHLLPSSPGLKHRYLLRLALSGSRLRSKHFSVSSFPTADWTNACSGIKKAPSLPFSLSLSLTLSLPLSLSFSPYFAELAVAVADRFLPSGASINDFAKFSDFWPLPHVCIWNTLFVLNSCNLRGTPRLRGTVHFLPPFYTDYKSTKSTAN